MVLSVDPGGTYAPTQARTDQNTKADDDEYAHANARANAHANAHQHAASDVRR